MRKHVTPADPLATIYDPERRGDLPAEGAPVAWTPYWAGLAAREDVTVRDLEEVAPAPPSEAEPAAPAPERQDEPSAEG